MAIFRKTYTNVSSVLISVDIRGEIERVTTGKENNTQGKHRYLPCTEGGLVKAQQSRLVGSPYSVKKNYRKTTFSLSGAVFYMEYLGRRLIITKGRFFVTRRSLAK